MSRKVVKLTRKAALALAVEVITEQLGTLEQAATFYENFGAAYGNTGYGRMEYSRRERLKAARAILLEMIERENSDPGSR